MKVCTLRPGLHYPYPPALTVANLLSPSVSIIIDSTDKRNHRISQNIIKPQILYTEITFFLYIHLLMNIKLFPYLTIAIMLQ